MFCCETSLDKLNNGWSGWKWERFRRALLWAKNVFCNTCFRQNFSHLRECVRINQKGDFFIVNAWKKKQNNGKGVGGDMKRLEGSNLLALVERAGLYAWVDVSYALFYNFHNFAFSKQRSRSVKGEILSSGLLSRRMLYQWELSMTGENLLKDNYGMQRQSWYFFSFQQLEMPFSSLNLCRERVARLKRRFLTYFLPHYSRTRVVTSSSRSIAFNTVVERHLTTTQAHDMDQQIQRKDQAAITISCWRRRIHSPITKISVFATQRSLQRAVRSLKQKH